MDRQLTAFNTYPEYVGLDAGYKPPVLGLEERGIDGVIGYRRPNKKEGYLPNGVLLSTLTTITTPAQRDN